MRRLFGNDPVGLGPSICAPWPTGTNHRRSTISTQPGWWTAPEHGPSSLAFGIDVRAAPRRGRWQATGRAADEGVFVLMTTVPTDVRRSYANRLTDDLVASGDITDADWRGAFAAPSSRDWTAALGEVASGTALESVRRDVENYASFPAHTEGVISRAPAVGEASEGRVEIVDCVELGDSRLIADTTEEVLDDLANRTPRYRFRAGVLLQDGRWLVDVTNPALDEPC